MDVPDPSPRPATPSGLISPATPGMFNFRFPASTDFKKKLERLAEVQGIANSEKNMAEVFERAMDLALEAKDPQRRLARREARARRRDSCAAPEGAASTPATSRHVPAAVRDRILERADHQCQFTGPDGTRCTAR